MTRTFSTAALAVATLLASAGPAIAQDRWDWNPGPRPYQLAGPGVEILFPELRDTPRGRAFVMRNFDWNHDGYVDRREAEAANRAFAERAGPRRERFDWDRHAPREGMIDDQGPPPPAADAGWDRHAMRDYGFRQTPLGARLTLSEDVLFQTDSDVLRPGAIDRLRPLAGYLRSNPGVRVAIDGYTDSRGSDAHNQALSQRRAESVRSAFDAMGVTRARFAVAGHGEREPVATNATSEGQRLNRRVEVTLLGQRADTFARD